MKPLFYVGLLVAGILGVGGYIRYVHDPYVRKTAALEAERDSSNRANDSLRHELVEHAQLDTVRQDSIAVLLKLAARPIVHRATDSLARRADSLEMLANAQATGDSAGWMAMREAFAAKDSVIWQVKRDAAADLERVRSELLGVIALDSARIATRDDDLGKLQKALAEMTAERDRWRKMAKPGFVLRLFRSVPAFVVGAVSALILHH